MSTEQSTLPSLAYKEVSYYEVEWTNLERFIEAVYGQKYDIVSDMEWSNDSEHSIKAEKRTFSQYEVDQLVAFRTTGKGGWILYILLDDLCNRGFIPSGEYLITVCW